MDRGVKVGPFRGGFVLVDGVAKARGGLNAVECEGLSMGDGGRGRGSQELLHVMPSGTRGCPNEGGVVEASKEAGDGGLLGKAVECEEAEATMRLGGVKSSR